MRFALVDGSNMVMRAAFGGSVSPEQAAPVATGLIRRAVKQSESTHLVVAVDCSRSKSWRRAKYPPYKAKRETDTAPWIEAASEEWRKLGWNVQSVEGFEADDIIATLAHRLSGRSGMAIVSSDSDLAPLTEIVGCHVFKPVQGGTFQWVEAEDVCEKYDLARAGLLRDLKALAGETGDNVPGVPGIGPKRASDLLASHGDLEGVIAQAKCASGDKVRACEATVRLAYDLVGLRQDVPVPSIRPSECISK